MNFANLLHLFRNNKYLQQPALLNEKTRHMGDVLSGELKIPLGASIAFDWSNALWDTKTLIMSRANNKVLRSRFL